MSNLKKNALKEYRYQINYFMDSFMFCMKTHICSSKYGAFIFVKILCNFFIEHKISERVQQISLLK